jgi:hypothetical protein
MSDEQYQFKLIVEDRFCSYSVCASEFIMSNLIKRLFVNLR